MGLQNNNSRIVTKNYAERFTFISLRHRKNEANGKKLVLVA